MKVEDQSVQIDPENAASSYVRTNPEIAFGMVTALVFAVGAGIAIFNKVNTPGQAPQVTASNPISPSIKEVGALGHPSVLKAQQARPAIETVAAVKKPEVDTTPVGTVDGPKEKLPAFRPESSVGQRGFREVQHPSLVKK